MATRQGIIRESYEAGKMKACRIRSIVKMSMCYSSNKCAISIYREVYFSRADGVDKRGGGVETSQN